MLVYLLALSALMSVVALGAPSASAAPPLRIALVSDTHTTRGTAEDQALYKGRLDRVIAAVNAANVDLVLIAGDLTQSGQPEELEDFQAQVKGFSAPVRWVYGNHDVGAKHIPGKEGGTTAERVARIEKSLGPSFWTETRPGVRIVGVNGSLFGSGLPREADQWAFLERTLARKSAVPTFLLVHYPPFLEAPDESGGDYWNIEPAPRARLLPLLKRGGVVAVLSGHLHYPRVSFDDGLLFVTAPPVSFGLPRGVQPQGWTLVTVSPTGGIGARTHYLREESTTENTESTEKKENEKPSGISVPSVVPQGTQP